MSRLTCGEGGAPPVPQGPVMGLLDVRDQGRQLSHRAQGGERDARSLRENCVASLKEGSYQESEHIQ